MTNNLMPQQKAKARRTYLSECEVAEWLNLSKRTLQNWRWNGEGPAFQKFGRAVRYATSAIEVWVAERERTSTSATGPRDLCGIPQADLLPKSGKGDLS